MNDVLVSPRASVTESNRRLGMAVLGAKLRATRNRMAVTRRRSPILTSLQFGVAVPAVVAFTALLTIGFASAMSQTADERAAITVLALMIGIGTIGAFIGSSTTALQALYLADDIPFLLTLPIPLRTLFASKLVEAMTGALLPMMLSVAASVAYGLVESAGPIYWLMSLLVILSTTLTSTALAVLTISGVTRYIPPRRARIFLFGISLVVIVLTAGAMQALAPRPGAINSFVGRSEYDPMWRALSWTPAGWSADALSSAADESWARAALFAGVVALSAGTIVTLSFQAFRRTFIRGLARTQAVQTSLPSPSVTRWLDSAASVLPRRFGALVLKEWFLLFRDLRRLSGAMWPVGIVLVYTVLLARGDNAYGSGEFAFWSEYGTLVLLPWGLSLGISVYSYGSEGRNVHLLRALPISASRIFLAKVIASLLPVALLSVGIAGGSLWISGAPFDQSLQLITLLTWMVVGFVIIDTGAAAIAPNFETDQVQRTIGLTGRLFSFVMGSAFGLATLLGAARLVLFRASEPTGISDILHINMGSIEPFGWPLVAFSLLASASVVGLVATIAVKQTNRLITSGL